MAINILSQETINKIAAGEVVERPANVVKELIENSIDAKCKSIRIDIEQAGQKLIRITDDGCGMSRQDMTLALTRHATSKISDFDDLEKLSTLGFRGEALPSIAAVSHFSIKSKTAKDTSGWEQSFDGGKLVESKVWAGSNGTIVEARNIFFNTPARRKFLKSEQTEKRKILEMIEEIALTNKNIAFTVNVDKKNVLKLLAVKNTEDRIGEVFGDDFAKSLLNATAKHPKIEINAFITPTNACISNKNRQYLFINGRPVNLSKSISHAVYEAYREHLLSGTYPAVFIYFKVNSSDIDVNIHPTKREVRFSNEQEIHELLRRSIKDALNRPSNIVFKKNPALKISENYKIKNERLNVKVSERPTVEYKAANSYQNVSVQSELLSGKAMENTGKALGQVFNLYIIAQNGDEMLIVDQHAACERIMFEEYLFEVENEGVSIQKLLFPINMDLAPSQKGLVVENIEIINSLGWEIEDFGGNTIKINAHPGVLGTKLNINEVISAIIDALSQETKLPKPQKIEKIIREACRKSIKANDKISSGEMETLIKNLLACKTPYTCPHGRPTMIKISKNEMDTKFRRNG